MPTKKKSTKNGSEETLQVNLKLSLDEWGEFAAVAKHLTKGWGTIQDALRELVRTEITKSKLGVRAVEMTAALAKAKPAERGEVARTLMRET